MVASLYIVATPIGNMDDLSHRAIKVLQQVDTIAAEDTRHSARLMQHYSITTPMLAYHEHGGEIQTEKLITLLQQGKTVALISDAGTPLISDPGYRLVKKAHELSIPVIPVPGASAVISALSVAGLPTDRFSYEGFLPAKQKARLDKLTLLASDQRTLVFYEAPHRISDSLADMCTVLGEGRRITMAREITKSFETIRQKSLSEMQQWVAVDDNQQRGEIVLVVEGAKVEQQTELNDQAKALVALLQKELAPKVVSKIVAEHYDLPKKQVYDYILSIKS